MEVCVLAGVGQSGSMATLALVLINTTIRTHVCDLRQQTVPTVASATQHHTLGRQNFIELRKDTHSQQVPDPTVLSSLAFQNFKLGLHAQPYDMLIRKTLCVSIPLGMLLLRGFT